jgi:hypothetical protein
MDDDAWIIALQQLRIAWMHAYLYATHPSAIIVAATLT